MAVPANEDSVVMIRDLQEQEREANTGETRKERSSLASKTPAFRADDVTPRTLFIKEIAEAAPSIARNLTACLNETT